MQRVLEIATDFRERAIQVDNNMQVHDLIPGLGAKLATALIGLRALGVEADGNLEKAAHGAEHRTETPTGIRGLTTIGITAVRQQIEAVPGIASLKSQPLW
jgi:hypothetical protein